MSPRPSELPRGTPTAEVAEGVARAFRDAGVASVLLRAPGVDAGEAANVPSSTWRHDLDVLVPRTHRRAAAAAMDAQPWRLAVGGLGAWARRQTVSYHWEYGPELDLHRGLPAGPGPSRSLRALEGVLFERARPTACGLRVPDAVALAVFSATQAARPTTFRPMWLGDAAAHAAGAGIDEVRDLARSLGLVRAVQWALAPDARDLPAHVGGPLFDSGLGRAMWRVSCRARRHARPERVGDWLSGVPRVGSTVVRSRFADMELRAGPGAFIPQSVTEPMVELALSGLPATGPSVACDVGTGVGGVALAVARARPATRVIGCDVSRAGLRWARRNARRHGVANVEFRRGSLLDPLGPDLADRVAVITGNVPYVPTHVFGPAFRDREGAVLGSGEDGLELHRLLLRQSIMFLAPKGRLVLQMSIDQWELFAAEMASWGLAPQPMAAASFEDAICWGIADTRPVGRMA
jgi:methylase of polypeptide subunit release factors